MIPAHGACRVTGRIRRALQATEHCPWNLILIALLLIAPAAHAASTVEARIVGITDGDTVKAMVAGRSLWKVRLAQIDAPEKGQPWGRQAKQALAGMIFGKDVHIRIQGKDRYGRYIGTILLGRQDINRTMVREGHAWAYRKYLRDRTLLDDEAEARRAHRGLWSLPESQQASPWEWRLERKRRH